MMMHYFNDFNWTKSQEREVVLEHSMVNVTNTLLEHFYAEC